MNREQRRTMAKQLKARGRDVVVLRGGPMSGWNVASDAPVLQPSWASTWPPALAEAHLPGHYELRPSEALAVWREDG